MVDDVSSKSQASNNKQYQSSNNQTNKRPYDLEDRTLIYAQSVRDFVNRLPRTIPNIENSKQLVRAAGSVGANYIEANEALSKKDFGFRVKIARKEAKESRYWLQLSEPNQTEATLKTRLVNEANELIKILSSILLKCRMFKY
jgi:four helix bundle protein